MPQPLEDQEKFVFSAAEVKIARAALYLARYHRDRSVADDEFVQTLTGVELSEIIRLMDEIDELTEHAQQARRIVEDRLKYLDALPDTVLKQQIGHAREIINMAAQYDLEISTVLKFRVASFTSD
jgi:hypothetical protein